MVADEREVLLELLAELGVTEQDYADIERAERIVEEVNRRLWARRAKTRYALLSHGAQPNHLWSDWDRGEETGRR